MRKTLSLLPFVLLLATFGAAVFLFWQGLSNAQPRLDAVPSAHSDPVGEAPNLSKAAHPPTPVKSDEPGRVVDLGTVSAAAGGEVSEILLRGRLVDRKGQPVADAGLELRSWSFTVSGTGQAPRKALSDADGRFSFVVARGMNGRLSLDGGDRVFRQGRIQLAELASDHDLGDVEVLTASRIRGVVKNVRGQPLPGISVKAHLGAFSLGVSSTSTTRDDGSFEIGQLHPGSWQLRTASPSHLPATVALQVGPEEQVEGVVLELREGSSVAGRVVDDRGLPVPDFKVGIRRSENFGGLSIERFTLEEATRTDEHGMFVVAGIEQPVATIRAFGNGYTSALQADVPVGTVDLLLRVSRLGSVSGTLQDMSGLPIAGSTVSVERVDGDRPGLGGMFRAAGEAIETAADGSWRIESVEPGDVVVRAEGPEHLPAESLPLVVQAGRTTEAVKVVADRGAALRVTVTDAEGRPVEGAAVKVHRERHDAAEGVRVSIRSVAGFGVVDGSPPQREASTDESGVAMLYGLEDGAMLATAEHGALAPSFPQRIVMPAIGLVDAELQLREPGFAEIEVRREDGATTTHDVQIEGPMHGEDTSSVRSVQTDDRGRLRSGPLLPGEYEASIGRDQTASIGNGGFVFMSGTKKVMESTRTTFRVVAGETTKVEVIVPVLTTLTGRVTDPDGPVADIEVELLHRSHGDDPMSGLSMIGMGSTPKTKTDEQGRYSFEQLEPGEYDLRWGKQSQFVKDQMRLQVIAGQQEQWQDLQLRYGSFRVRVLGADGMPLEGAKVTLQRVKEDADGGPRIQIAFATAAGDVSGGSFMSMTLGDKPKATTNIDGIAVIQEVPLGNYRADVTAAGHVRANSEPRFVVEGRMADAGDLALSGAGRIDGSVVDARGNPVGMALVFCRPVGHVMADRPRPAHTEDGTFKFDSLPAGRYELRAQRLGPDSGEGPAQEVVVDPAGEPAKVQLRLADQN